MGHFDDFIVFGAGHFRQIMKTRENETRLWDIAMVPRFVMRHVWLWSIRAIVSCSSGMAESRLRRPGQRLVGGTGDGEP
jgi:hypothetical protein